jgi:hypothetical protein
VPRPDRAGVFSVSAGQQIELTSPTSLVPTLISHGGRIHRQPYRIVLTGEKSSLGAMLHPIARRAGGEMLLSAGEASDTHVPEIAARADDDGRPLLVLYFSDFDPSGWQMPISVSRKLQALGDLLYPNLQVQFHRVALTHKQAREFSLPSTPLKQKERRATTWRKTWGHEQTEIDPSPHCVRPCFAKSPKTRSSLFMIRRWNSASAICGARTTRWCGRANCLPTHNVGPLTR